MGQLSPMMKNYLDTKEEYKDCILFYRLGDFYEMFFDDAELVSRELELTLTGKSCGLEERAPMCGVPFHSAETYINLLIEKGYKVAICEQVEDPKQAKGLVRREVTRIVTPGTNVFTTTLDESKNNYLMGIVAGPEGFGIATVDVTTGEFSVTEQKNVSELLDEINRVMPSEIIANDALYLVDMDFVELSERLHIAISALPPGYFSKESCDKSLCDHFHIKNTSGLGLDPFPLGSIACGCVMQYLVETQKCSLSHITRIRIESTGRTMLLDRATRRNLELVETMREKEKRGSLLWVLDKTKTAMGARLLRSNVEQPLLSEKEIIRRYDAIDDLNADPVTREELREYLNPVYDLERLISKISYQSINARDMLALGNSLAMLPAIRSVCVGFKGDLFRELTEKLDPLTDLAQMIAESIAVDPLPSLREGGIIRNGYNEEVDTLRLAKTQGKDWISDLESKEKEKTGIKNLRIKYNKVFGYYFEVTKSFLSLVPEDWIRKQTLTNAERFTTSELNDLEEKILGAQDRLYALEYALFCELRDTIANHIERIQKTAAVVAQVDMLASLAYVAERENYCRPKLVHDSTLLIRGGRHPVIEKMIEHDLFVSNDTELNNKERIAIITGPNMAGKSTYMRQTALIQLMAQMGSFVPAKSAKLTLTDRIFTRVGASDDLASGQSTFMVEMTEVANILQHATERSLIILDEIGRGTSTFDGLSIAWAVVEYIADKSKIGAKTLFATHYHELTELEGVLAGVKNYCIAVKEDGDDVIFLRKIISGGADRSYGIQVAKLAGVPAEVLDRARVISDELEKQEHRELPLTSQVMREGHNAARMSPGEDTVPRQLSIFDTLGEDKQMDSILCEIRDTDLTHITPMDAINLVHKWQKDIDGKW